MLGRYFLRLWCHQVKQIIFTASFFILIYPVTLLSSEQDENIGCNVWTVEGKAALSQCKRISANISFEDHKENIQGSLILNGGLLFASSPEENISLKLIMEADSSVNTAYDQAYKYLQSLCIVTNRCYEVFSNNNSEHFLDGCIVERVFGAWLGIELPEKSFLPTSRVYNVVFCSGEQDSFMFIDTLRYSNDVSGDRGRFPVIIEGNFSSYFLEYNGEMQW